MPHEGAQIKYGGRNVTEKSVILQRTAITLEFRHVKITTPSGARIVQLAKIKAITYLLTSATAFSAGRHLRSFDATQRKN